MHAAELQERDKWAIMMLWHTKGRHTQEHKARTPNPERDCKTCEIPFISRAGMKVHQRLKPQCANNMTQEDQNNKACPDKTATTGTRIPDKCKHTCSITVAKKHTPRSKLPDCKCKKNSTRTIHTGVTKENTTYLQNNMTYNAGTQQWTCNMCSRTGQPQDVQNAIRHILWR